MSVSLPRSPELLHCGSSRLVLVDLQSRLLSAMPDPTRLTTACRLLIEGAKLLQVPAVATEQYPQGLGETIPELAGSVDRRVTKMRFSAAADLGWPPAAQDPDRRFQVVLAGVEGHVCVLQTALDMLSLGYTVFVAMDAVASRRELDWKLAGERLASAGAVLTTVESVLFEWCETADAPEFKSLSGLVKARGL